MVKFLNVKRVMMTSSNGNIFRVTGHLCGEFTGPRWIPRTKASDAELWFFSLICVWINDWVNNGEAGDLRRYRIHYDVTVMCENGAYNVLKYVHLALSSERKRTHVKTCTHNSSKRRPMTLSRLQLFGLNINENVFLLYDHDNDSLINHPGSWKIEVNTKWH